MGWTISTDEPQPLLTALYVRDISGLRPQIEPAIPPLSPRVEVAEHLSPDANRAASAQWVSWWNRYLQGGGPWPAGKERPEPRDLGADSDFQRQHYWWMDYKPPEFAAMADQPELQDLARKYHGAGWAWSEAQRKDFAELIDPRKRRSTEPELIEAIERRLGRDSRSFVLDIRILPIEGFHGWRLAPNRVLVSAALFADVEAYRKWIRPVIEELAVVDDPQTLAPTYGSRLKDEHTVRVELTPEEQALVFEYAHKRRSLPAEVRERLLTAHGYGRFDCRIHFMQKGPEEEVAWLMCKPRVAND